MSSREQTTIVIDPTYGFRRLDPLPSAAELEAFYSSSYMELIEAGGRAPEIRRLLQPGTVRTPWAPPPEPGSREAELAWIKTSLYADIECALHEVLGARGRLLDVGCGTGDFVEHALERGWAASGIEPSRLASERARARGLSVTQATLEQQARDERGHDAITMLNVLEHVRDPIGDVRRCRALLAPRGALAIVVPNDFTEAQAAAAAALGIERQWWVAVPDHLNYFDFASLERMLVGEGFAIAHRTCNFPMELFLMMGDDYVSRPALGPECHARRKRLEAALPVGLRRTVYQSLAAAGLGRNCVVIARRTD